MGFFGRHNGDPNVYLKFVGTKEQSADILTKGSRTGEASATWCELCLIMPINKFAFNTNTELSAEVKPKPEGTKPEAKISFFREDTVVGTPFFKFQSCKNS